MEFVYGFAPGPDGPVKIGYTNRIKQRLPSVQIGYWEKLYLVYFGTYYIPRRAQLTLSQVIGTAKIAAQSMERMTHVTLKRKGLHLRGEWFDIKTKDVSAEIDLIAHAVGAFPLDNENFLRLAEEHNRANLRYTKGDDKILRRWIDSQEFANTEMEKYRDEFCRPSQDVVALQDLSPAERAELADLLEKHEADAL